MKIKIRKVYRYYKVWLGFRIVILGFTLFCFSFFKDSIFLDTEEKYSNIYHKDIKIALIIFGIMCFIEAYILYNDYLKDKLFYQFYSKTKKYITDCETGYFDDAMAETKGDNLIDSIKKTKSKLKIKLSIGFSFLLMGVYLIICTNKVLDDHALTTFKWPYIFLLFKIFFVILTLSIILDCIIKLIRIDLLNRNK